MAGMLLLGMVAISWLLGREGQEGRVVPALNPSTALRLYCSSKWFVWMTEAPIVEPFAYKSHVQRARRSYFRQRGVDGIAECFLEETGSRRLNVVTVMEDGTVLAASGSSLAWHYPDGDARKEELLVDGDRMEVAAAFPDALVLRGTADADRGAVYYVPLRAGGELATESRVSLIEEGEGGSRTSFAGSPIPSRGFGEGSS